MARRIGDRHGGRDILVGFCRDIHFAGKNHDAGLLADVIDLVAGKLALEFARLQGCCECAITDPVDLDIDLLGVDGDDGNALLATAWQNVSFAGEAHQRRSVGHINRKVSGLVQVLADFRGQTGFDLHLIALPVGEAFDAQLMAFLHEVLRVLAIDGHELRDVALGARQIFGKLQADARRCGFGVDLVIHHPEAVLGAKLVKRLADGLAVGNLEAQFQSVDGRAPI